MEGKIIVKNPNGSSKAWDHFGFYKVGNKILKDKAVCKICNQECKYTGGTTNLNQHLQKHHSNILVPASTSPFGGKKSIQQEISSRIKRPVIKLDSTSKDYQMATESIAEYIFGDLVPLSTVESPHFRGVVNVLSQGRYEAPKRKYFTDTLLPKLHENSTLQLKKEVEKLYGIGITTDGWTSSATENYLTYTAHYISEEWELKTRVLSTHCSEERHTADNLAKDMQETEQNWGLDKLLFSPVYVHDNAANITKVPKLMPQQRTGLGCLAHTINLAANAATSIDQVANILSKGIKLVALFNRSAYAEVILKRKQSLLLPEKQHKLIQDCVTRWNSSYDMLERLHEQSQVR